MAKCTNCKKKVPEGAKFCGHCGKPTGFEPNYPAQPPLPNYKVKAHNPNEQTGAATVKPNCDLSVAGFVLSIFNPLMCLVSFILSCAALAKKQLRRKLAIAGLIISLIEIVAIGVVVYLVYTGKVDISQYIPWLQQQ